MRYLRSLIVPAAIVLLLSGRSQALTISGEIIGETGFYITYIYAVPTTLDTIYITFANPFNLEYSIGGLEPGGYVLFSFQDLNTNITPDLDEPRGFYGENGVPAVLEVVEDSSGVDIELQEPNTGGFTGTISYEGALTGATFVAAFRTPAFSDTISGIGFLLTNTGNGDYTAFVDSFGVYYAYAYMDVNGNFTPDPDEPYDVYGGANPAPIEIEPTDFPDDIDFVLEVIDDADEPGPYLPVQIEVGEIYPNPFNSEANLPFTLATETQVKAVLYDLLGRRVSVLADQRFGSGTHTLSIHATNYPTGLYYVGLEVNGTEITRRMVVLK